MFSPRCRKRGPRNQTATAVPGSRTRCRQRGFWAEARAALARGGVSGTAWEWERPQWICSSENGVLAKWRPRLRCFGRMPRNCERRSAGILEISVAGVMAKNWPAAENFFGGPYSRNLPSSVKCITISVLLGHLLRFRLAPNEVRVHERTEKKDRLTSSFFRFHSTSSDVIPITARYASGHRPSFLNFG